MKIKKKLYAVMAVGVCGILAAGGIGCHFLMADAKELKNIVQETTLQHGDLQLTFTGEGTTSDGSVVQKAAFDVTTADFVVEEVCAEAGTEVAVGDTLYKISEESISEAMAYYEEAVADASAEAEKAGKNYEIGKAEAEYTRAETKNAAESAERVYQAENSSLSQKVTDAQNTLEDAKTQISVYQNHLDQNTYYADAGVEEKKEALQGAKEAEKKAKQSYQEARSAYSAAEEDFNSKFAQLQQSAADVSGTDQSLAEQVLNLAESNQVREEKKAALTAAEGAYQKAAAAREQAKEAFDAANISYEKAVSEATAKKETLEQTLTSLELAYTSAVNAAAAGKTENQNTYDTAVSEGAAADTVYETTVAALKNSYEEKADKLQELKEEQAALLAMTDGRITAEYSGVIKELSCQEGQKLTEASALVSYSDTDVLTVETEVSQENIAKISVGDTVDVKLAGMHRDTVEGTVASVASEATAGRSMSNVTYTVAVTILNSEGTIEKDTSAYVIFSYGELTDVDYIDRNALSSIDGTQAVVTRKKEDGEKEQITVGIGESTDQFTVITEGLTADDICLIERGGKQDETQQ